MSFFMYNYLYTENPSCGWSYISKIAANYEITTRHGKLERPFNETNAPKLEAGDIVELQCAESIPPRRPIIDQEDDDELDGIIRMFCMSPPAKGQSGRYGEYKERNKHNSLICLYYNCMIVCLCLYLL